MAGLSRSVLEASVVRIEPHQEPRLVFDTLVHPQRSVAATEIHGITNADVADAPLFSDIAGDFVDAIRDSVVCSYNVCFDRPFLEYEVRRSGQQRPKLPHFCVMYLRSMMQLGNRSSLEQACREHGQRHELLYLASTDATVAAEVLLCCLKTLPSKGIQTFGELAALGDYKFLESFDHLPWKTDAADGLKRGCRTKQRALIPSPQASGRRPLAIYWDALIACLADLTIEPGELAAIQKLRTELCLPTEQIAMLHARAFGCAIDQFIEDKVITAAECEKLNRLHECLRVLGWVPGDPWPRE